MTTNQTPIFNEEGEQLWVDSQATSPVPAAAAETTSPDMTTEAPSVSAVSITNVAMQALSTQAIQGNSSLSDQVDALSQQFMVNQLFNGSALTGSAYQNFFAGGSNGTVTRRNSSSHSKTKTESLAAFKPVTSPVTGDLKGSVKMVEVSTKPSRSTKKRPVLSPDSINNIQW